MLVGLGHMLRALGEIPPGSPRGGQDLGAGAGLPHSVPGETEIQKGAGAGTQIWAPESPVNTRPSALQPRLEKRGQEDCPHCGVRVPSGAATLVDGQGWAS